MKKKLLFIFIISFGVIFVGFSQEKTEKAMPKRENSLQKEKKEEKLPELAPQTYTQRYGLRIGADISKPIRSFFDKDYWGIELVGDYRWNYRYYLAGEIGKEKKTSQTDYFNFTTDGQYIRLGIDYNSYDNWYGMENMIYVGGRYGFAQFSQEVNSYTIHTLRNYWNENITGTNPNILTTYNGRTAHWLELVIGMKVELFKNLYAGASVRFSKILFQKDNDFPNFWIPGVNRVWESSTYGINYNYTITYMIPLYKKIKPIEQKSENKK
ncbi:DUF6048 family protein [Capnocytophaga catalasegens]|nr:DUF6048 family protein [Capnocytophaga catalasegens]